MQVPGDNDEWLTQLASDPPRNVHAGHFWLPEKPLPLPPYPGRVTPTTNPSSSEPAVAKEAGIEDSV